MASWTPELLPMVEVIIDQVRDHQYQTRDLAAVRGLMVHRVGVDLKSGFAIGYDAKTICDAFLGRTEQWKSVARVTGHQNAYTFYVGGSVGPEEFDGKIWQALPIDEIGHHGLRFSRSHIGLALIGDFRVKPPSARQWHATMDLCADLVAFLRLKSSDVVGHGEVPGAHSGDKAPSQRSACPGDLISMKAFRFELAAELRAKVRQDASWRLEQIGVILP